MTKVIHTVPNDNAMWVRKCRGVAVILALGSSSIAIAQSTNARPDAASANEIKDIIVTARKSAESLQKVPIAITAISSEDLETSRIISSERLSEHVPGFVASRSGARGVTSIRGIITRTTDVGGDGAVGIYVDEVYQPRLSNSFTSLIDLERVEILMGPQGTLFGRNTIAGAVNYVTKKPGQTFRAQAAIGMGNRGSQETRISISGPLSPTMAVGAAAFFTKSDGNVDVVDTSNQKIGDDGSRDRGARLSLRWTPTTALDINASASYVASRGANVDLSTGNPAGNVMPQFVQQGLPPSAFHADHLDYKMGLTIPGFTDRKAMDLALRADLRLSDSIKLTSLTAYQDYKFAALIDTDLDVQDIFRSASTQRAHTFSQEVRLSGGEAVFRWNVGGNYFVDTLAATNTETVPIAPLLGVADPLFGYGTIDVKTTSWAAFAQGYVTPINRLELTAGVRYSHDKRDYVKTLIANPLLFPAPSFDSRDYPAQDVVDGSGNIITPGWNTKPTWHDVSYTFAVKYNFSANLMAYISHSKGYRSGGIQSDSQTVADARENYGPENAYQTELGIKSSFLGGRLIINLAAYHITYKDVQVHKTTILGFTSTDNIQNAAEASINGLELGARFTLAKGLTGNIGYAYNDSHFKKYASNNDPETYIAFLNDPGPPPQLCASSPTDFRCSNAGYIFDGVPFEFAPKHTLTAGLTYAHELSSGAVIQLHGDYAWKSTYLLDVVPQDVYALPKSVLNSRYLRQPAFGVLNGSITLKSPGRNWNLSVWGHNLTNKFYAVRGDPPEQALGNPFASFQVGDRRTYGATLAWRY